MPRNNFRYTFFIRIAIESEGFLCHSVRVDSPERAQNLDLVVEQLMALKDSIRMEIRILEADEHPHYELKISDEHIDKTFVRDASPRLPQNQISEPTDAGS